MKLKTDQNVWMRNPVSLGNCPSAATKVTQHVIDAQSTLTNGFLTKLPCYSYRLRPVKWVSAGTPHLSMSTRVWRPCLWHKDLEENFLLYLHFLQCFSTSAHPVLSMKMGKGNRKIMIQKQETAQVTDTGQVVRSTVVWAGGKKACPVRGKKTKKW